MSGLPGLPESPKWAKTKGAADVAGARLSDRINGALQPSKHLVNSIAKCIGGNPASALVHGSARGYNLVTMTVSAGSVVRTMMGSNVVFLGPRTSEQVASVNVFNGGETTTGKTYTRTMAINGGAEAVQELMPEFEEVKKNLKGKDAAKRAAWLAQPQNAGHLAQLAAAGGDLSEPFSGSGDEYSAKFFKLASMLGSVAVNWTAETGKDFLSKNKKQITSEGHLLNFTGGTDISRNGRSFRFIMNLSLDGHALVIFNMLEADRERNSGLTGRITLNMFSYPPGGQQPSYDVTCFEAEEQLTAAQSRDYYQPWVKRLCQRILRHNLVGGKAPVFTYSDVSKAQYDSFFRWRDAMFAMPFANVPPFSGALHRLDINFVAWACTLASMNEREPYGKTSKLLDEERGALRDGLDVVLIPACAFDAASAIVQRSLDAACIVATNGKSVNVYEFSDRIERELRMHEVSEKLSSSSAASSRASSAAPRSSSSAALDDCKIEGKILKYSNRTKTSSSIVTNTSELAKACMKKTATEQLKISDIDKAATKLSDMGLVHIIKSSGKTWLVKTRVPDEHDKAAAFQLSLGKVGLTEGAYKAMLETTMSTHSYAQLPEDVRRVVDEWYPGHTKDAREALKAEAAAVEAAKAAEQKRNTDEAAAEAVERAEAAADDDHGGLDFEHLHPTPPSPSHSPLSPYLESPYSSRGSAD